MMTQLKQWFHTLSGSEQRLLFGGTLLVSVAVSWVAIYQPITKHINEQSEIKIRLQTQLEQMQKWSAQSIPSQTMRRTEVPQSMTFSSWLDQQLQAVNLQQMVNRTEPIDDSSLSVWLQGAPFNQVIDWLQDISERYAVRVDQIDINVVDSDLGLTDIRMRLVK